MEIEAVLKRLALIKYLFGVGLEQANKPEPVCWVAVLTFHDAVELFLQLVAEHFDIKKRLSDVSFMEYWSLINPCLRNLGKGELAQIISMERLNKARRDFKHYGHPPSKSVVNDDFRTNTANFFIENTSIVFDINFADISLLELVECKEAREDLKQAEEFLNQNKIEDSLDKSALAFQKMIFDYESRKEDEWGRSPFYVGPDMTFLSSLHIGIGQGLGRLGDFIDKTNEAIEAIQEIVKIIGFGIDYKRYALFKILTPIVGRYSDGTYDVSRRDKKGKDMLKNQDAQFCIDFVIESALKLQEFDYEVMRVERK
jgi:hypothetical protein